MVLSFLMIWSRSCQLFGPCFHLHQLYSQLKSTWRMRRVRYVYLHKLDAFEDDFYLFSGFSGAFLSQQFTLPSLFLFFPSNMLPPIFVCSMNVFLKYNVFQLYQPNCWVLTLKCLHLQALLSCPTSSIHTEKPASDILQAQKTFPTPIDQQRIPVAFLLHSYFVHVLLLDN